LTLAHRFYPLVPTEFKLLPVDEAIAIRIEDGEYLLKALGGHIVDVSLVVAEQSSTDYRKFGKTQAVITGKKIG